MKRFYPHFPSFLKKLKRGPAVLLPKDVGAIIAYSGIGKESIVLEAGGGSGFLTAYLGRIAKKVITYEKDERWIKLLEENIHTLGLKNVIIKHKDILDGIDEKEIDAVVLDMPEAHRVVKSAFSCLRIGGTLVGYLPNIEQMKAFYLEAEKIFSDLFSLEILLREYRIREKEGVRPEHFGLWHTAFLVFARKL